MVDADVVVITAAAPLTVNRSRMVYLRENAPIMRAVTAAITPGWPGTLVVVTNPVDPLCTWLQRELGLDRRRVLGYTANDSLRLRTAVGDAARRRRQLGRRVGARRARRRLRSAVRPRPRERRAGALSAAQRAVAEDFLRNWYIRHVALDSGRSSTWTSGHVIARMIAELSARPRRSRGRPRSCSRASTTSPASR